MQKIQLMAASLVGTLAFAAVAEARVDLLSHRAAYRLSLDDGRPAKSVESVRGGLVMEWRADCDGWIMNQRLGFVATTTEGPGFVYDIRFSSWESIDNTELRFTVRNFDASELREEFRGEAALEAPGGSGLAHYEVPEESVISLPSGTIFPTEHLMRLIESAERGEYIVSHDVFDGSGPDALTNVTAFIGQAIAEPDGPKSEQRWPISLAYHLPDHQDDVPEFEISFELTRDGVLHDVTLDYGEFALIAELESIEELPVPSCQ